MAVFPCDWSNHRYPGPQRTLYFTTALGGELKSTKLRLCEKHFVGAVELIDASMAQIDEDSAISDSCERCQGIRATGVYAKVYDEKKEPVDYAVDLCGPCLTEVAAALHVANGTAMRQR